MVIQCPDCKKIKKFGCWIEPSSEITKELESGQITILNEKCKSCELACFACKRLIKLENKFIFWDGILVIVLFCIVLMCVLYFCYEL